MRVAVPCAADVESAVEDVSFCTMSSETSPPQETAERMIDARISREMCFFIGKVPSVCLVLSKLYTNSPPESMYFITEYSVQNRICLQKNPSLVILTHFLQ